MKRRNGYYEIENLQSSFLIDSKRKGYHDERENFIDY